MALATAPRRSTTCTPTRHELAGSRRPLGPFEPESRRKQPARHDAPALEGELRIRPEKESSDLRHPSARRQADAYPTRRAQGSHEIALRQRMRRRQVHRTRKIVAIDQHVDGAHEVAF